MLYHMSGHSNHSLVTVENKMFVIPYVNNNCEVFDIVCKKFVDFKLPHTLFFIKAMSIRNKMIIFQYNRSSVVCYDVEKDEWSEEICKVTEDLRDFLCVKMAQY